MNRWIDGMRSGALALTLAGVLANCGGGGGGDDGGGGIRLFFGMNGQGSCNSVVVNVDLAGAGAVLARTPGDTVDCVIDAFLASNGCTATFNELGTTLRATIGGCTIPEVINLFSCVFDSVDISDINSESVAQCACTVAGCDGGPPLCIDEDIDPRSCEDCDNGRDDDGNGLEDCEDPNCENAPECQAVTTTTNPSSTTSTSLPPGPISINFILEDAIEPLGALQFTANYTSAPGRFVGDGDEVECFDQAGGDVTFAAQASDATSKLTLGFISLEGIESPTPLATCLFEPDTPVPVPSNFTIVIDVSTDTDGNRVRGVDVGVTVTGVEE